MLATTYGETHKKVEIISGKVIKDFLEKEKNKINFFSKKSCLYSEGCLVEDVVPNYLNDLPVSEVEKTIKNIILKEFYSCENKYPYLGDYFLSRFFDLEKKNKSRYTFKFNKQKQKSFVKSIEIDNCKNILSWLFKNISLERIVAIENHDGEEIIIDCSEDFTFRFDYDFDYYQRNVGLSVSNYRFIIIDGMIESVGEIHHLMEKANKTKEPYVIFCHGINEEVKYNILKNNAEGRTQILPVNINFNEETLNVLNDLAVVHNDSVVSSKMGQTISQEVRGDLKKAPLITFYKNRLIIKSNTNDVTIKTHRQFLRMRILEGKSKGDVNTDILIDRLKSFSTKTVKIYIPESINSKKFSRELDYSLRFMSNLEKDYVMISSVFKTNYFIPCNFLKFAEQKIKSTRDIIDNIDKILV